MTSPQSDVSAQDMGRRTPPIVVQHLTQAFKGRTALDDITLTVPPGAVVGLVGANGAGKTTLLRCLLGLSQPQQGRLTVLDENPMDLSDSARARMGYVPQTPALIDWMTVGDYLDYIGTFYRTWDAAHVQRLMHDWNLTAKDKIATLSLGQKQRLSLVQALGHRPELLLLDEPVASLDPLARREFIRTLFDHAATSGSARTVVISSHLLTDLQRIITHLLLLRDGRVVLFDEWDVLSDALALVNTDLPLPLTPGLPGVLAQHPRSDGKVGCTAVIDQRVLAVSQLGTEAHAARLNLDDLFVELMS